MHKRVEQTIASLHIWGGSGPPTTLEFDIDQPGGSSLPGAKITISYNGETVIKTSDNKGLAIFYEVPTNTDIPYTVTASGYAGYIGSVNIAPGEYGWVNIAMSQLQPQGEETLFVGLWGEVITAGLMAKLATSLAGKV